MGNYHPHGDAAIYDAMARLAQDFVIRYPLVDGQGNFGNIDGDNPAASRYTEARMTAMAEALLEGLDEDAVDFRDNYDGTLTGARGSARRRAEPSGQRVQRDRRGHGHEHPAAQPRRAAARLPAPDQDARCARRHASELRAGPRFPDRRRHRGAARPHRRGLPHRARRLPPARDVGGRGSGPRQWQIVVTEIPYQVQKSKLIEKLAELIQTKKVPILADVRDESADDIRIVLEPRSKNVDPEVLMGCCSAIRTSRRGSRST
jgi:topoisomerase-4 subunit A